MVTHKKTTIKDVAQLAEVSTATVSRVINDSGPISEDLREKVLKAIDELDYRYQKTSKKPVDLSMVAILVGKTDEPFFMSVVSGIFQQTEIEDFFPVLIEMPENKTKQNQILKHLGAMPYVGIIASGFFLSENDWIAVHEDLQIPIVVLNTLVNHTQITSIRVKFEQATYHATQHLLSLNHKRIAFIGSSKYPDFSRSELQGIKQALTERGFQYPDEYEITVPLTPEGASQAISRLMMLPDEKRPTAIFAFDDEMAIYAIKLIRDYGLSIPDDISIIGFDNITMSAHTNPPLTTIDVPTRRMGRQTVVLLRQLMEDHDHPLGFTFISGSLVVRESTGPCPV